MLLSIFLIPQERLRKAFFHSGEAFLTTAPHFRDNLVAPFLKGFHNISGVSSHCIVIVLLAIYELRGAGQSSPFVLCISSFQYNAWNI